MQRARAPTAGETGEPGRHTTESLTPTPEFENGLDPQETFSLKGYSPCFSPFLSIALIFNRATFCTGAVLAVARLGKSEFARHGPSDACISELLFLITEIPVRPVLSRSGRGVLAL